MTSGISVKLALHYCKGSPKIMEAQEFYMSATLVPNCVTTSTVLSQLGTWEKLGPDVNVNLFRGSKLTTITARCRPFPILMTQIISVSTHARQDMKLSRVELCATSSLSHSFSSTTNFSTKKDQS